MSFHSDLMTDLKTDIDTALSLKKGTTYVGREVQRVTVQGIEVWVQPVGEESIGRGGGDRNFRHTYNLHVRLRDKREGNQTGENQLLTVKAHMETLRDRYDGERFFTTNIPTLLAMTAEAQTVDTDPQEQEILDGMIILSVTERDT